MLHSAILPLWHRKVFFFLKGSVGLLLLAKMADQPPNNQGERNVGPDAIDQSLIAKWYASLNFFCLRLLILITKCTNTYYSLIFQQAYNQFRQQRSAKTKKSDPKGTPPFWLKHLVQAIP